MTEWKRVHNSCIVFTCNKFLSVMHRFTFSCEAVLKTKKTSILILKNMKKHIWKEIFPQRPCYYTLKKVQKDFHLILTNKKRTRNTQIPRTVEKRKTNQMNIFILAKKEILRNLTI